MTYISKYKCKQKLCKLVTYINKSSCDEKCHFRLANCVKLLEKEKNNTPNENKNTYTAFFDEDK